MSSTLKISASLFIKLNPNLEVELINQKGCELLGFEADKIIGKPWIETVIPERHKKQVKSRFQNLLLERPDAPYQN
ncbi:MAG: PAS domain S-box protein [Bacteroidales bacterium]|nr:PAS domain S-box protein [Bacteroidales bacterium]